MGGQSAGRELASLLRPLPAELRPPDSVERAHECWSSAVRRTGLEARQGRAECEAYTFHVHLRGCREDVLTHGLSPWSPEMAADEPCRFQNVVARDCVSRSCAPSSIVQSVVATEPFQSTRNSAGSRAKKMLMCDSPPELSSTPSELVPCPACIWLLGM